MTQQTNWTYRCRAFQTKTAKHTHFSSAHRTFSKTDNMQGYKMNFNQFKRIEIISSIFCNYNSIKLEIHYRKNKWENKQTHEG